MNDIELEQKEKISKLMKNCVINAFEIGYTIGTQVNNELENLKILLEKSVDLLAAGGKVAIISFHSLEDRIIKYNFRENADKNIYRILTKKPLVAGRQECLSNPRARSAKLRIAQKIS